jgi:hypothetical protein
MIFVLFVLIFFAFLVLGSIAFLVCALIPPTRQYALSAGLWFVVSGICSVALLLLAGLGFVTGALAIKAGNMQWTEAPKFLSAIGWSYLGVGALITILVATCAAWLHQKLVHRFTFALFRLYAAVISAGIGSVFGWLLSWCIAAKAVTHLGIAFSVFAMLILIVGFGMAAYKCARWLRGKAPSRFTWISPEEFAGSNRP